MRVCPTFTTTGKLFKRFYWREISNSISRKEGWLGDSVTRWLGDSVSTNMFQNAEILEKKNKPSSIHWILPYIKPGSKRFLSWDKCRGLNFAFEVGPCCVVSLVTLQKRGFEELATICARLSSTRVLVLLGSKCLVMFKFDQLYMATTCRGRLFLFSEPFFAKTHRKSQDNNFELKVQPSTLVPALKSFGSWLNIGWNPTYAAWLIFFSKISAFWNTLVYNSENMFPIPCRSYIVSLTQIRWLLKLHTSVV